jgi:hypothetical protein
MRIPRLAVPGTDPGGYIITDADLRGEHIDPIGSVANNGSAALWYAEHLHWQVFPVHGVVEGRCTCGADA